MRAGFRISILLVLVLTLFACGRKASILGGGGGSSPPDDDDDFSPTYGGNVDPNFNSTDSYWLTDFGGMVASNRATAVLATPNGGFIVGGYTSSMNSGDFAFVRYKGDGALDTGFSTDGKLTTDFGSGREDQLIAMTFQGEKIVAVGHSGAISQPKSIAVARYLADGTLDQTFDTDGRALVHVGDADKNIHPYGVYTQGDKVVIVASGALASKSAFVLVRLLNNGALDPSFGDGGKVITVLDSVQVGGVAAWKSARDSAGNIYVSGVGPTTSRIVLVRYSTEGVLDTSFATNGIFKTNLGLTMPQLMAIGFQSNGKIVLTGLVDQYSTFVARLWPNGTVDSSFGIEGYVEIRYGAKEHEAWAILIQGNDKILIAGRDRAGSISEMFVQRLLPDGVIDESFGTAGSITASFGGKTVVADALAWTSDNKLVVVGTYRGPTIYDYDHFITARFK